jgi:CRP-like cAMP-binding protein
VLRYSDATGAGCGTSITSADTRSGQDVHSVTDEKLSDIQDSMTHTAAGRVVNTVSEASDGVGKKHMSIMANVTENGLLTTLHGADRARIFKQLEVVDLSLGEVLCEADQPFRYGYFPVDAIVSILYVMANEESAEIAVVGNEGMVGVAIFMGGQSTSSRAIVQNAGSACRLTAQQLQEEFSRGGAFMRILLRYSQALITQMVQTAACNRHHTVDQQLCRWLLMSLDRLPSNELVMTQKLIGNMLGIDNAGVAAAASNLKSAGLIDYHDGTITVLSRPGLIFRSCECYDVVKRECARLLESATGTGAVPAAVASQ